MWQDKGVSSESSVESIHALIQREEIRNNFFLDSCNPLTVIFYPCLCQVVNLLFLPTKPNLFCPALSSWSWTIPTAISLGQPVGCYSLQTEGTAGQKGKEGSLILCAIPCGTASQLGCRGSRQHSVQWWQLSGPCDEHTKSHTPFSQVSVAPPYRILPYIPKFFHISFPLSLG